MSVFARRERSNHRALGARVVVWSRSLVGKTSLQRKFENVNATMFAKPRKENY